ncbi:hypothetical protein MKX01_018012 [Papaver californicum]|nr:hypothetical protein MKX01_018012 [Papaver californicum]
MRNLIISNGVLLHYLKLNQVGGSQFFFLLLRQSPTHFSTQSEQQHRLNQEKVVDGILRQPPTQGSVYAKLFGIGMFPTINELMSLLESCNLGAQDIKVQYNNLFLPVSMVLQLPPHSAYYNDVGEIARKGKKRWIHRFVIGRMELRGPLRCKSPERGEEVDFMGTNEVTSLEHNLEDCKKKVRLK